MGIGELPNPKSKEELLLQELLKKVTVDIPNFNDIITLMNGSFTDKYKSKPTDICAITAGKSILYLEKSFVQNSKEKYNDITYSQDGEKAPICNILLSKQKKHFTRKAIEKSMNQIFKDWKKHRKGSVRRFGNDKNGMTA